MQKNALKIIPFVLTALWLAFIWCHSVMDGTDSAEESLTVLEFIFKIFDKLSVDSSLSEHILRKFAHFSEFGILGILLAADTAVIAKSCVKYVSAPLFVSLAAAAADETIQIYSPGRSSSVIDVWIDFAGAVLGIVITVLIYDVGYKYFVMKSKPKK